MGHTIRPCTAADLDALREIARETYDQAFRHMNTADTMEKYLAEAFDRDRLAGELANASSRFSFLFADGELAGYTKTNEAPAQSDVNDTESLELERIYVRSRFQGRGFGKLLLHDAERQAESTGKRYLWLGVWERNLKAVSFYRTSGFREAGRHSFRMGDELQSDFIMRKDLARGPSAPTAPS